MKINKETLPLKAHYFFYMGASAPISPYLIVYGKDLGISADVIGGLSGTLPLILLFAKPGFGLLIDYFYNQRKLLFISLMFGIGLFQVLLYFFPPSDHKNELVSVSFESDCHNVSFCMDYELEGSNFCKLPDFRKSLCSLDCLHENTSDAYALILHVDNTTSKLCVQYSDVFNSSSACNILRLNNCQLSCRLNNREECIYNSLTFYGFMILNSLTSIGFNVAVSVSDAICFDMLGEGNEKGYGRQRVWGSIGGGIMSLLGGFSMDWWSENGVKNYKPAFIMVIVLTFIDLYCCSKLKLPSLGESGTIFKNLGEVMRHKKIIILIIFAILIAMLDSFFVYFLFWYLEDIAQATNRMSNIKLLEGITTAAETLAAEVIFFSTSGKIIQILGYQHSFSIYFLYYALRLGLVAFLTNPWWVIPIEFVLNGPTYALSSTTIVAYSSSIAPPGTSAVMQGIVSGIGDGIGFAIGGYGGGFLYKAVGGKLAFQIFSLIAVICCIAHFVLYKLYLSKEAEEEERKE